MILGTQKIQERLDKGEIFRKGTWCKDCIKEASYALRVAKDGMVVNGKSYYPGNCYQESVIKIEPGRIAILSTVERLCMPADLVGKLGVRLDFASKGLTGLMGIQVDPYYGSDDTEERLYIKVASFGNETVKIHPYDAVFNVEFSRVEEATKPQKSKKSTWYRLQEALANQDHSDWTFVARVQTDLGNRADDIEKQVNNQLSGIRNNQQSVVMFGVFLVAVAIFGALIGVILNVDNAPNWVANWGWIVLLGLCSVSVAALVGFVIVACIGFWKVTAQNAKIQGERHTDK